MNRFLFVIVLVGAVIIGLGFYRGWFHLGSDNAEHKSNVTLSVDKDKIKDDEKKAVEKVQDLGHQVKDKNAAAASNSHDGKAVSITEDKLVMTNTEGSEQHTHLLAADLKVTCDGKVCKSSDVKPGMRIRVTTDNVEPHAATRIEALDNNSDFKKGD